MRKLLWIVAAIAVLVLYGMKHDRPKAIGGHWAMDRDSTLYRVGEPGNGGQHVVAKGLLEYRFFEPDCVLYRARESYQGEIFLAVCGDRTPVTVAQDFFRITDRGLRTPDVINGTRWTVHKLIAFDRIRTKAEEAGLFDRDAVPRSGTWGMIPSTGDDPGPLD